MYRRVLTALKTATSNVRLNLIKKYPNAGRLIDWSSKKQRSAVSSAAGFSRADVARFFYRLAFKALSPLIRLTTFDVWLRLETTDYCPLPAGFTLERIDASIPRSPCYRLLLVPRGSLFKLFSVELILVPVLSTHRRITPGYPLFVARMKRLSNCRVNRNHNTVSIKTDKFETTAVIEKENILKVDYNYGVKYGEVPEGGLPLLRFFEEQLKRGLYGSHGNWFDVELDIPLNQIHALNITSAEQATEKPEHVMFTQHQISETERFQDVFIQGMLIRLKVPGNHTLKLFNGRQVSLPGS